MSISITFTQGTVPFTPWLPAATADQGLGTAGPAAVQNNRVDFGMASLPLGISCRAISYYVDVAAAAGTKLYIGVFTIDGTRVALLEGQLDKTGIITVATNIQLSPGLYWIGTLATAAGGQILFWFEQAADLLLLSAPAGQYLLGGSLMTGVMPTSFDPHTMGAWLNGAPLLMLHSYTSSMPGVADPHFVALTSAVAAPLLAHDLAWNHSCSGASRILLVSTFVRYNRAMSVVTYDGVPLTFIRADGPGGDYRTELWYLVNPPEGTHQVYVELAAGTSPIVACAVCLRDIDQANPIVNHNGGGGASEPTGIAIAPATGGLIVDAMATSPQLYSLSELYPYQLPRFSHNPGGPNGVGCGLSTVHAPSDASIELGWDLDWAFPPSLWAGSVVALRSS